MPPLAAPRKPLYLLATDGSESAELAIDYALTIAQRTGARLHVIAVAELSKDPMGVEPNVERKATLRPGWAVAEASLKVAVGRAKARKLKVEGRVVQAADPSVGIVREAEDEGADMIILGSRGLTGIERMLLGSVAERVVERAHCPVLVVR